MKVYYDKDADAALVKEKKIAVIVASSLERLEIPYEQKELKPKDPY